MPFLLNMTYCNSTDSFLLVVMCRDIELASSHVPAGSFLCKLTRGTNLFLKQHIFELTP